MMAGANPAAVQRILRHTDPRITTEIYGHLAPDYLRREIDLLRFEKPANDTAAGPITDERNNPFGAIVVQNPTDAPPGGSEEFKPPLEIDVFFSERGGTRTHYPRLRRPTLHSPIASLEPMHLAAWLPALQGWVQVPENGCWPPAAPQTFRSPWNHRSTPGTAGLS